MSQSDYIRYKRIGNELREQKKLEPVIDSGKYAAYKAFTVENTVTNSIPTYNKLQSADSVNVFGMQVKNDCYTNFFSLGPFNSYSGTYRLNRKPLMGTQINSQPIPKKSDKFKHKTPADLKICKNC